MPMVACDSGSNVSCILPGCLPDPESVLEFHFRTPVPTGTETETLSDSVKKKQRSYASNLKLLGSRLSVLTPPPRIQIACPQALAQASRPKESRTGFTNQRELDPATGTQIL